MSDGFDDQTVLSFFLMDSVWFGINEDEEFQAVSEATRKMWGAMASFRNKMKIEHRKLNQKLDFEQQINEDHKVQMGKMWDQIERLARAFTDITDAARIEAPEFYNERIAPLIANDDPRPDWWLVQEYCPRTN